MRNANWSHFPLREGGGRLMIKALRWAIPVSCIGVSPRTFHRVLARSGSSSIWCTLQRNRPVLRWSDAQEGICPWSEVLRKGLQQKIGKSGNTRKRFQSPAANLRSHWRLRALSSARVDMLDVRRSTLSYSLRGMGRTVILWLMKDEFTEDTGQSWFLCVQRSAVATDGTGVFLRVWSWVQGRQIHRLCETIVMGLATWRRAMVWCRGRSLGTPVASMCKWRITRKLYQTNQIGRGLVRMLRGNIGIYNRDQPAQLDTYRWLWISYSLFPGGGSVVWFTETWDEERMWDEWPPVPMNKGWRLDFTCARWTHRTHTSSFRDGTSGNQQSHQLNVHQWMGSGCS